MFLLLALLENRFAKVVVVGQGYVGLPVAVRAVEVGFNGVGFDVSTERIEALARGASFVGDGSRCRRAAIRLPADV